MFSRQTTNIVILCTFMYCIQFKSRDFEEIEEKNVSQVVSEV